MSPLTPLLYVQSLTPFYFVSVFISFSHPAYCHHFLYELLPRSVGDGGKAKKYVFLCLGEIFAHIFRLMLLFFHTHKKCFFIFFRKIFVDFLRKRKWENIGHEKNTFCAVWEIMKCLFCARTIKKNVEFLWLAELSRL